MAQIPNFRHLLAILAAARLGRISYAAEEIHLSQPAMTQAVMRLERLLGARLFDRTGGGLVVTEIGRVFVLRIARAVEWLEAGVRNWPRRDVPLHSLATTVQWRSLIAVVENASYTLAAKRLGVSQPSVHRATRDFERLCGLPLLQASPQGVEATPAARELARCAALAFEEIRQGLDEIREARGIMDGQIRVGCLPLARTQILPTAVTRFLREFPDARIRIVDGAYGELLHALRHGQLDIVIGALRLPAPAADIDQEALFSDPLSIVVRADHPILREPVADVARLTALGWIVAREGTPARDHFHAFLKAHGIVAPQRIIECSSLIAARGLLLQSDRAAVLSATQVRYEVEAGQLAVLPMPLPDTQRLIGITTRRNWQSTLAQRRFVILLREAMGEERTTLSSTAA